MKKAQSSYDLAAQPKQDLKFKNPMKYQSSSNLAITKGGSSNVSNINKSDGNGNKHKVVIYFSDAYNNICNNKINGSQSNNNNNVDHANRLANEMQSKASGKDFMAQLKTVLEEKSKFTNKFADSNASQSQARIPLQNKFFTKPAVPEKPNMRLQINQPPTSSSSSNDCGHIPVQSKDINEKSSKLLPSFIESIDENNVIKLKIEQNFKRASELVSLIASLPKKKTTTTTTKMRKCETSNETSSIHELHFSHEEEIDDVDEIYSNDSNSNDDDDDDIFSEPDEGYFYDWSFVQDWRSR